MKKLIATLLATTMPCDLAARGQKTELMKSVPPEPAALSRLTE